MANYEIVERPDNVDWIELHALLKGEFAYMAPRIDPPSSLLKMNAQSLKNKAKDEELLIATAGEKLIACMFCRAQHDWLYVGKVAVQSNFKGQGISRDLFERAKEIARYRSLKSLELETRIELIENHRTFENLGFRKVGEDAHEGFDRPTSIRMRLVL